jgi:hypothetical protein
MEPCIRILLSNERENPWIRQNHAKSIHQVMERIGKDDGELTGASLLSPQKNSLWRTLPGALFSVWKPSYLTWMRSKIER